jgi:hypothetical protein
MIEHITGVDRNDTRLLLDSDILHLVNKKVLVLYISWRLRLILHWCLYFAVAVSNPGHAIRNSHLFSSSC